MWWYFFVTPVLGARHTDNSYMGDTIIEAGLLVVGSADALGLGTVRLLGGTLETAANNFDNTITAAGTAEILVQQGSILKLGRKIYNTEGVLTLNGIIDISALQSTTIEATMVDVNGELGDSGFTRGAATGVQLVQGGTVEATGATVLYNGEVMTVDRTGFASSAPTIDYSVYSINDRHAVAASEISSVAGSALSRIDLNSGTLTADIAVNNLKATGGTLLMPNQVLVNGTVQDTMVYASAGQLNATLSGGTAVQVSGAVTISGNNTHTGGTILNNGTNKQTESYFSALRAHKNNTSPSRTALQQAPIPLHGDVTSPPMPIDQPQPHYPASETSLTKNPHIASPLPLQPTAPNKTIPMHRRLLPQLHNNPPHPQLVPPHFPEPGLVP